MADVGQTLGRQWCLGNKVGAVWCLFKFDLMSYDKAVNDFQFWWIQDLINPWNMIVTSVASVTIMFHGLIKPCIHLIESHQLYIVLFIYVIYTNKICLHRIWLLLFLCYCYASYKTDVYPPPPTPLIQLLIFLVFYVVLLSLFCLRSVSSPVLSCASGLSILDVPSDFSNVY
jgi:hypothetical protein